jgi:hypothetical protein
MGRTIIVGDVHGCRMELEQLLDRVAFASGDRLVFVGDLVARGPDSLGVLDVARRTGAVIVRGNHEQKLLSWHAARLAGTRPPELGRLHAELARALRPVDWTLLDTSPLWLDLPEHGVRVVHAGLMPGVPMEEQDAHVLLNIRTLDRRGERRFSNRHPILWGALYQGAPHVVFGHNAVPGLQLHPWATGIDTGCVYGGRLTAVVLRDGERLARSYARREQQIVSQRAARVYFEGGALRPRVGESARRVA